MKFSSESAPPLGGGPAPILDRRALERLAVGAPPPTPPAPVRAIERGARVRRGWPARPVPPHAVRLPRRRPQSAAPEIAIGRRLARARPPQDLSFEPLYLLVPDPVTWSTGAGAEAALAATRRFAGGRAAILLDLDTRRRELTRKLAAIDQEGVAEALEFGLSLEAVARELEPGVLFVPLGDVSGTAGGLYRHEGWKRIIRTARRRGDRLLAYVPSGPHLEAIAKHAGAVLLLSTDEEEPKLRAGLPASLPIVGSFEPPAMPAGTIALEDLDRPRAPTAASRSATVTEPPPPALADAAPPVELVAPPPGEAPIAEPAEEPEPALPEEPEPALPEEPEPALPKEPEPALPAETEPALPKEPARRAREPEPPMYAPKAR
ncbi:MAG TPA: hypothetical protein VMN39_03870, partial [Longimicrobiaceae bacterium]|nr:hypothetical protein [Longimicrobiaceae bacterium]